MLYFNNLSNYNKISHFITTKKWGYSNWTYDSLNLALHVWDQKNSVIKNRELLAEKIWKTSRDFVYLDQVHSDIVLVYEDSIKEDLVWDAIITSNKWIVLMVLVADCVPLILYDKKTNIIWVVHAWWRWTSKHIVLKTISKMVERFDSDPCDIIVWIWPSICQKNYEVWKEVFKNFDDNFYSSNSYDKALLNLQEINKHQAIKAWCLEKNIEIFNMCSLEQKDLFFSARRDWVDSWRFWLWIYLK